LHGCRGGQIQLLDEGIEFALGSLKTGDVGGVFEVGGHLWSAGPDAFSEGGCFRRIGTAGADNLTGSFTQQVHDGSAFTTSEDRERGKHGLVFGETGTTLGWCELVGHDKKVEST